MADFEPPSFSLGLDLDSNLFDSEPQITPSSNQSSVAFTTFNDELQTLVVDDSEPELTDSLPKLNRLRRRLTVGATSSSSVSAKPKAELTSTAVINDEDTRTGVLIVDDLIPDQHLHTQHHVVCTSSNSPQNRPVKRKQHLLNDQESDSTSCNGSDSSNSNLGKYDDYLPQHVKRKQNVSYALNDFPKACRYFFHDDLRIQELVRSRLSYFSPLGNMIDRDLEQPSTSKIDYMGQFSFAESSRQAARTNRNKKSSSSRKISSKSETEEMSQGWVNPKLGVDKGTTTKRAVKRKGHAACQTAGHWLTMDGKKVYVGKSGQELTGRGAYMQYKKESGLGFKKVKRQSVTKKKK